MDSSTAGSAEAAVARLLRAFSAREWRALRTGYHPSAQLVLDHRSTPVGPDEAVQLLRKAADDWVYDFRVARITRIEGASAAIASGTFRRQSEGGGIVMYQRHVLYTVLDGLVYRARAFTTETEARTALDLLGLTLGIPDPAAAEGNLCAGWPSQRER